MTPQTQKYIKYSAIGLAAAVGLYLIFSKLGNNDGANDPTGNTGNPGSGGSSVFNVKTATAKLYELMRYSGSDEAQIVAFFRYITPAQFSQIVKEFGARQYNATLGNQINPIGFITQLPYKELPFWLENELSAKQFGILQAKYPNDL